MINRAKQLWPEEITINLVQHNKELKPLGRLLAMRMLLDKHTPAPSKELNPYRHELNRAGTCCAFDCPACRWAAEKGKQQPTTLP